MSFERLLNKGLTLAIAAMLSQGCSNHFVQAVGPNTFSANEAPSYFPLEEGYQAAYEIGTAYGSPEIVSYTVGKDVPFLGGTATLWIVNDNGHKDTSYFVQNGSALMYYEGKQSVPEIVLDLPLTLGKSWSRFDTPESQITDTSTTGGGIIIKDSSQSGNGISFVSSFPVDGLALMTVDKTESVELSNGRYYSGVYRVSNEAGGGTQNYYWYAPGVGMIKYVLGGTNPENPTGGVQAEMISHGYAY